jgi:hypothetical protein
VEALPLPSTPFLFQSKTNHGNNLGNALVLALAQEECLRDFNHSSKNRGN